jgi:hypothetical protein
MDTAFAAAGAASDLEPAPQSASPANFASHLVSSDLVCLNSNITLEEVHGALRRLEWQSKADGGDGVKGELLKYSGFSRAKMIHRPLA